MKLVSFLIAFFFVKDSFGQIVAVDSIVLSNSSFNEYFIKSYPKYINPRTNSMYGCSGRLECEGGILEVRSAVLRKDKSGRHELELEGFYYLGIANGKDTLGIRGFSLFLAQQGKDTLENIRSIFTETSWKTASKQKTRYNGYFHSRFLFERNDCLYVDAGGQYRFREYSIYNFLSKLIR
jgi:hypothetical protein